MTYVNKNESYRKIDHFLPIPRSIRIHQILISNLYLRYKDHPPNIQSRPFEITSRTLASIDRHPPV